MSKIHENNVTVLIVRINCYDEMIVDKISNRKLNPILTKLFT